MFGITYNMRWKSIIISSAEHRQVKWINKFIWIKEYQSSKAKYMINTDSEQVTWVKVEKDLD